MRVLILALMLLVVTGLWWPSPLGAQVEQGATMTVLRGEIALIRADGSANQPAPSGAIISIGDEIRTIGRAGALITFFAGTEIEMGADTILVVEQLSKQGDRVDVSLRQVLGATVHRVQTLAGSGSTYQIQAGGAVALVRGTTFALVGPVTTAAGNVVTLACLEDCSAASTFAGCAMGPFSGLGVAISGGQVASECVSFGVDRAEGLFDAATHGVTTTEQRLQGDTRGVPAGQVAGGQRQQSVSRTDQQERQDRDRDPSPHPTANPSTTPATPAVTLTPTPTPQSCNVQTTSGGAGTTTTVHSLGRTNGTFAFRYEAFSIKDRFQVIYEGSTILDTGPVAGGATSNLTFSGAATTVSVIVTGPAGTGWNYTVSCPT